MNCPNCGGENTVVMQDVKDHQATLDGHVREIWGKVPKKCDRCGYVFKYI